jgi:N-acetylglucosamine-6-phosphate deacetylase
MRIFNAQIIDKHQNRLTAAIIVKNGMITEVTTDARQGALLSGDIDAHGLIVTPGWIDIQINGGLGFDFTTDPSRIWEVGSMLPRYGVTGFLPTIITSSADIYQKAISVLKSGPPNGWRGARPLGWHFEGPFLNPAKKGAHNPAFLHLPDADLIQGWSRENGVLLVTMAPELPGALEIARSLVSRGVVVSAGHSMATIDDTQKAVENGYTAATHLFNAMPPLDHRSPGLAAAVLLDDRITAGLIADGLHVHPDMVDLAWRLKGPEKIVLITDAVGALGIQPGIFVQGGMEIVVDDHSARLRNGTLAGSILGLDEALRNVMRFTHSRLEQVLPAMSHNQSKLLRLEQNGEIRPGFRADLTFLREDGQVELTMVGGDVVIHP